MILSQNQKKQFWTDGFLLVENAINDRQLKNLKKTFLDWVNESRNYKTDYGETMDGRPRLTYNLVILLMYPGCVEFSHLKKSPRYSQML